MPSTRRRFAPQLGLAVLGLLILAIAAVVMAPKTSSSTSKGAAPHVLTWANEGISDIYTLDPARGPDFNARQALQLIFGGLVRFGPHFAVQPDVAQRWHVSGDRRTYTFYLRQNARFGDGTPVTAADVAYSLNRTLSKRFAQHSGAYFLSGIKGAPAVMAGRAQTASGIQVLGPYRIRLQLERPSGSFLARLANPCGYIVPRKLVAANPVYWTEHAVGTGPFKVVRWVHNNALLLAANPYYYGGKVRVAALEMPFIPEPLSAWKGFQAGTVDTMGAVHFPVDALYDAEGRSDFHQSSRLESVYLTPNLRVAPFNNTFVRQAFAHALDKSAIVQDVYAGFARPTDGMLPPGIRGYDSHLRGDGYDPTLARSLLARAGYSRGRGLPVISFPVDQDAQSVALVNEIASQWRQVLGVTVRPVQYTHSAYLNLLSQLRFQIAVIDWTADYPDPENFLTQLLHSGSPNNNGAWDNTRFDRLTDRAATLLPTDPQRYALYHQAEEIAMRDAAAIPLVNPKAGVLIRRSIHGLTFTGGYLLVQDWTRVYQTSGAGR